MLRNFIFISIFLVMFLLACEQPSDSNTHIQPEKENPEPNPNDFPDDIKISISGVTISIKLEDNTTTRSLVATLRKSAITYTAGDYGGFEKVGTLGFTLPTNPSQITAVAGDVILYGNNQIVLFYGSNSWSYTRIGKMIYNSLDELKSFLKAGEGNIQVTLSL